MLSSITLYLKSKKLIAIVIIAVGGILYAASYYSDPLRTVDACIAKYGTSLNKDKLKGLCGLVIYNKENKISDNYEDVYQECKKKGLMQLKSPSTAKLDNIAIIAMVTDKKTGLYFVTYTVDSQNAIGGTLRSYTSCTYDLSNSNNVLIMMDSGDSDSKIKETVMERANSPLTYEPKNK
jgi:hypothetical protein